MPWSLFHFTIDKRMDVRERCPEGVFAKARDLQLRDHVTFSNEFPRGVLSQFIRL